MGSGNTELYHGSVVEKNGQNVRLSHGGNRNDNNNQKNRASDLIVGLGVLILFAGLASGGPVGLIGIVPGLLLIALGNFGKYAKKGEPVKTYGSAAEKKRKAEILRREKKSYASSSTYREHYPHKEVPQTPINWDNYREHIGPSREKRLQQIDELLEAGLLDKDEYRQKKQEIENS